MAPNRPLSRTPPRPPKAPPTQEQRPAPEPALDDGFEDDLGAGVAPEEVAPEETAPEVAPEDGPLPEGEHLQEPESELPFEDEPPPFPEGYVPKTMAEATLLERWRGRHHLRHYGSLREAEFEAGKAAVVDAERMAVEKTRSAAENERADLERKLQAAKRTVEMYETKLEDPRWLLTRERGDQFE